MAQDMQDLKQMKSVDVRGKLVEALELDLVGPTGELGDLAEVLSQSPSRWYLTGFLVPIGAAREQRSDESSQEEVDQAGESGGTDDDVPPEKPSARRRFLPSSIGMSLLVPGAATTLKVHVSWGDYKRSSDASDEWERKPRS